VLEKQQSSRDSILDAASSEFAERGFDGVRMEHVARRAGLNKTLIYRHFGDKDRLFRECLAREFQRREQALDGLPSTLSEMLVWWAKRQQKDRDFILLILRESIADRGDEPVDAKRRSAYYQRQVRQIEALQSKGEIDPALDPQMLFVALLALTIAPVSLPQIARMVVPRSSTTFASRWASFLRAFAEKLR
jgi:AcrR family transcriptional regulator